MGRLPNAKKRKKRKKSKRTMKIGKERIKERNKAATRVHYPTLPEKKKMRKTTSTLGLTTTRSSGSKMKMKTTCMMRVRAKTNKMTTQTQTRKPKTMSKGPQLKPAKPGCQPTRSGIEHDYFQTRAY
jgi:hypothetical protein